MDYKVLEGSTILIIEDNPTNLDVLISFLEQYKVDIRIAVSGDQALERVEKIMPDLILLDVMMPGKNGYETCTQLKKMEKVKDIPVIFMTALAADENQRQGFESGAVDYITKPLELFTTLSRLNIHLLIQRQKKKLTKLNSEKDLLFSVVAHDLRSPMLNLMAQEYFLAKNIDNLNNQGLSKDFNDLRESTKKIFTLIENLLDWSLIQLGKMVYTPEYTDLQKITCETVSLLGENAGKKNIEIDVQNLYEGNTFSDSKMIKIVLRNLLDNAVKFSNNGGRITVRITRQQNDYIQIAVSDNGKGIPDQIKDMLFDIKQLPPGVGTGGEKGAGLGLFLCKEIVEKNGGEIWAQSGDEEGTTFFFTLPTAPFTELN